MILERTGDSRWYMKHAGLCGSVDEWWSVLRHYLEGFDERSREPVYVLGSWDWLCDLMGVDSDEDDDGFVSGA